MTQPLSPFAQAVLADYSAAADFTFDPEHDYWRVKAGLAAALRALADQVVPDEDWPDSDQFTCFADWNLATERCEQRKNTRAEIFTIAAELEGGR